jgi:predicted AAA+ superfamily ATPase
MIVKRDFFDTLKAASTLEAVLLWGPRQVGKTTLLTQLDLASSLFLDDLSLRQKAQRDPALVMDDLKLPCLIDEAQYAPNLFPEIKLRIDRLRRERLKTGRQTATLYYITGSNRLLLDRNVKESLAGRSHLYSLHGFSVREILANFPGTSVKTLLWKGGFPELYTRPDLATPRYINDYILSFIEKDIAVSVGIEKIGEFQTVLGLLAARSGQFLNVSEVAGAAGVDQKTVQSWMNALQTNFIIELVPPFHSNLSKRITKMKKMYFYDVGLCARLQGHTDESLLWNSAQAGSLFETLVFSEIIKTKANFLKDWRIFTWRTKEQNEVDFVLQNGKSFVFIEAKMAIHGAKPFTLDAEAQKVFPSPHQKIVVTVGGDKSRLDRDTISVPIHDLGNHLLEIADA